MGLSRVAIELTAGGEQSGTPSHASAKKTLVNATLLDGGTMKTRIALSLFAFTVASLGWAQTSPNNTTNFPMIGIVRGQTLQINIAAYPPDPCFAQIGFQDANGTAVGTSMNVTLQTGQSASLSVNANTLVSELGQRIELLPTVVPTAGIVSQCDASAEVFDNLLGSSSVIVPGTLGYAPSLEFAMLGVTELQTVRLNVVAFPPVPCVGELSFVNNSGVQVGNLLNVQLAAGQAASLDLPGSTLVTKLGQRAEVRPVVTAPNGGCVASAEIYSNAFGFTTAYIPPDPCSPSSAICSAFQPQAKPRKPDGF